MDTIEFRTHEGDRVRIKSDVTSVYPFARAYMEGTVKAQRRDPLGYPQVYVEWDKNHWAYSGEGDGWTFESHFDPIVKESEVPEKNEGESLEDAMFNAMSRAMQQWQEGQKDNAEPEPEKVSESESSEAPRLEGYAELVQRAFEAASEGQGFYIIIASEIEHAGRELLVPVILSASREDADEAYPLMEATMADLAAQAHAQAALREIAKIQEDRDARDSDAPTG